MHRAMIPFLLVSLALSQPKNADKASQIGYESIRANDLRAHLTFLSSSELEGRETSYRGQKVAAQYIASVFRKLGLQPLGTDGSYFQPFNVIVTRPGQTTSVTFNDGARTHLYAFGRDFLTTAARETTITATPVLLGYQDAVLKPDQLAGIRNSVIVMFSGRRDPAADGAQRSRRFLRVPEAAGAIIITDEANSGTIENQIKTFANALLKGQMAMEDAPARPRFVSTPTVIVSSDVGTALLASLGTPLAALRQRATDSMFVPMPIPRMTVTLDFKAETEVKSTENVAGLLEGSDPQLKNEYVLFTGHYDHLGVSAVDGAIYHGADDDGSGTSTVLELAEAFATNPVKPKRSLVFMTVTGEEKGLFGSSYYSEHPLVPLERTIADINIDMIGRVDKKHVDASDSQYVYVIGSDKISTELDSLLNASNKQSVALHLDYQYNDDNDPNQFYRRSDHYNFARKGVPIVFFFTGVHDDYHRPTDTVDKIFFDNMVRIGRLAFTTGWKAANFKRMLRKDGKPSAYSSQ